MNLSRCCLFSQLCTCSHKVYICSLKVDTCSLTVYTLSRSSLTVKSLFVFLSFYHTFFLPFSFHCVPNTASLLTVLQTLEFVNSCVNIYIYIYPHSHAQTNIRTHQNALFFTPHCGRQTASAKQRGIVPKPCALFALASSHSRKFLPRLKFFFACPPP